MGTQETADQATNPLDTLAHTAGTDIGMRREENQDSFGVIQNERFHFYIVADGMGGVQGGATASGMAVAIVEEFLKNKETIDQQAIASAVMIANQMIYEKGVTNPALNGMGTTFVGLAFLGTKMYIANVGDSRAYRFRSGKAECLTEDHTLVMELVRSGTITPEQAGNHPVSHMLTRSLGPTPEVEVDCFLCEDGPLPGDKYLLCSDGLYNLVSADEMQETLNTEPLDQAVKTLINLANQRGGSDNVTVIVIEAGPAYPDVHLAAASAAASRNGTGHVSNAAEAVSSDSYASQDGSDGVADGAAVPESEKVDPYAIPELEEAIKKMRMRPRTKEELEKEREEAGAKSEKLSAAPGSDSVTNNPVISGGVSIDNLVQDATAGPAPETAAKPREPLPQGISRFITEKLSSRSLVVIGLIFGFLGGSMFVAFFDNKGSEQVDYTVKLPPVAAAGQDGLQIAVPEINRGEEAPGAAAPFEIAMQIPDFSSGIDYMLPGEGSAHTQSDSASSGSQAETASVHAAGVFRDNLGQRRETLVKNIKKIEEQLAIFDRPISGQYAEKLTLQNELRADLEKKISVIDSEIKSASAKLLVWYQRNRKLQESDPTNLATEVAGVSQAVKNKKDEFEQATWNYLKEVEVAKYLPSDKQQKKKVDKLVEVRNEKMHEMIVAVKKAINQAIQELESSVADLNLQRDRAGEQIDQAASEIDFLKIIIGNDVTAKAAKKKELQSELEDSSAELKELDSLLSSGPAE